MGSRKKPEQLRNETNYEGAFLTAPKTEELAAVENWQPDPTLLNSSIAASFGATRRGIEEGTGGYSGINNPVLARRMQQIGLQETSDREASARADADMERNKLKLQQLQFVAAARQPQYIQTKQYGFGEQMPQGGGSGVLGGILQGGLGVAAAF